MEKNEVLFWKEGGLVKCNGTGHDMSIRRHIWIQKSVRYMYVCIWSVFIIFLLLHCCCVPPATHPRSS